MLFRSDLLAVQGTLKSLLQYHSSKPPILLHSAFFIVQLSHKQKTAYEMVVCDWSSDVCSSDLGCESWTIKKAEHQRIDGFELWYWRRLLRVPWTIRRSTQSILKEISPEYSLEGLMLKLKLQYSGYLMQRTDSLEKTLLLGKIEGRRKRG